MMTSSESAKISSRSFATLRGAAMCGLTLSALAACASQPPEYAWSHSASGEYLFAFDVRECGDEAQETLSQSGELGRAVKQSPAFFDCMSGRGYFLVDPATGLALTTREASAAVVSSQAVR